MLSIVIRPLVLVALFFTAAFLAHIILRFVPPGKVRNLLTRRMVMTPTTEAERRDWLPVILIWAFTLILFAAIWYADPLRTH